MLVFILLLVTPVSPFLSPLLLPLPSFVFPFLFSFVSFPFPLLFFLSFGMLTLPKPSRNLICEDWSHKNASWKRLSVFGGARFVFLHTQVQKHDTTMCLSKSKMGNLVRSRWYLA